MYALYVRQKMERSIGAAEEGKVTSQEEMEKRYFNDARFPGPGLFRNQ